MKKLSIKNSKIFSVYSLIISIIGLGIIAFLTFDQSISKIALPFQRQIIGLIFASICSLGIIAGISPKRCSQRIHSRIPKKEQINLKVERIKGHHPACENFSNHVVKFGKRTYCIGCIGMVTGAIISLIGSIFYFFTDFYLGNFNVIIFLLGFLGILYGLTFWVASLRVFYGCLVENPCGVVLIFSCVCCAFSRVFICRFLSWLWR